MNTQSESGRRQFSIDAGKKIGEFPEGEAGPDVDHVVYYGLEPRSPEERLAAARKIADTLSSQLGPYYAVEIRRIRDDSETTGHTRTGVERVQGAENQSPQKLGTFTGLGPSPPRVIEPNKDYFR